MSTPGPFSSSASCCNTRTSGSHSLLRWRALLPHVFGAAPVEEAALRSNLVAQYVAGIGLLGQMPQMHRGADIARHFSQQICLPRMTIAPALGIDTMDHGQQPLACSDGFTIITVHIG